MVAMKLAAFYHLLLVVLVDATSIAEIKGNAFRSPLAGKSVHDVKGIVAAKVRIYIIVITAGMFTEK